MDILPVQKQFVKKFILFPLSQVLDQNNEKMPKLEESNSGRLFWLVMARGRCWTGAWKRALEITGFLVDQGIKDRTFGSYKKISTLSAYFFKMKSFQRLGLYQSLSSLPWWLTQWSLPSSTTMMAEILLCLYCLKSYCSMLLV